MFDQVGEDTGCTVTTGVGSSSFRNTHLTDYKIPIGCPSSCLALMHVVILARELATCVL